MYGLYFHPRFSIISITLCIKTENKSSSSLTASSDVFTLGLKDRAFSAASKSYYSLWYLIAVNILLYYLYELFE